MKQILRKTGLYALLCAFAVGTVGIDLAVAQTPDSAAAGALASETRPVEAGITAVGVMGPIDLKLRPGNTPSVTLRAERRLLQEISTVREGETLRIHLNGRVNTRQPISAEVTLPALRAVQLMGSGDADIGGFSGEQLKLGNFGSSDVRFDGQYQVLSANLHGSGDLKLNNNGERVELNLFGSGGITATGKARTMTAKIMGSGSINAKQLQTETSTVSVFGSGDAQVFASSSVAVSSRGSGDVTVYGKPAQRAVSTSGSGSVRWQQ